MSTNEDMLRSLGRLLHTGEGVRDAVHIAVIPAVAAGALSPGQRVGLVGEAGLVGVNHREQVGIVDPFLTAPVQREERFWLFLFPGSITSLRHDWTHPAFPAFPNVESVGWLRAFAARYGVGYDEMVSGAVSGEGCCFGDDSGPEDARDGEFWRHIEAVTGRKFDESHRDNTYFRCAC